VIRSVYASMSRPDAYDDQGLVILTEPAPAEKPTGRWVQVWLLCVAFYYPCLWLSVSVSEALPALIRVALWGYRLAEFRIFPIGVVAWSASPNGPARAIHSHALHPELFSLAVPILFLFVAMDILALTGGNTHPVGGLFVATLANVPLAGVVADLFLRRVTSVRTGVTFAVLFSALCIALHWMLTGWVLSGYWKRVGSLFTGFVLLPALPWLGLRLFSGFRFWDAYPLLLMAPAAVAAALVSLRKPPDIRPPQVGWKPVAWGAAISLLLVVAVERGGRAVSHQWMQKRSAENRAAMALIPETPPNLPYPKVFFQKGVNFTAEFPNRYDSEGARRTLRLLPAYGVNAIALVPYGWSSQKPPRVHIGGGPDTWESDEGVEQLSRLAHYLGMRVLLKPAIWDAYKIELPSRTDRATWFDQYGLFLEHYAQLAKQIHADIFCIGGEFTHLTQDDRKWRQLIRRVRGLYPGPLVYAANFGAEFEAITFWDALDYIGLQEYYPLPDDLSTDSVLGTVETVQQRSQKPLIFTEAGFTSSEAPNRAPWEDTKSRKVSLEAQARCYDAILRAFYNKPWFQGVYWWKVGTDGDGGAEDVSLTPWGKPAMDVVKRWYTHGHR